MVCRCDVWLWSWMGGSMFLGLSFYFITSLATITWLALGNMPLDVNQRSVPPAVLPQAANYFGLKRIAHEMAQESI